MMPNMLGFTRPRGSLLDGRRSVAGSLPYTYSIFLFRLFVANHSPGLPFDVGFRSGWVLSCRADVGVTVKALSFVQFESPPVGWFNIIIKVTSVSMSASSGSYCRWYRSFVACQVYCTGVLWSLNVGLYYYKENELNERIYVLLKGILNRILNLVSVFFCTKFGYQM